MSRQFEPQEDKDAPDLRGFDDFELLLGDIMRGERATKGKSLLDVQRELKIRASYIAAIENTDPSAFETPGFIAGYVRSYARYLGLDPEWAFKTFCDEGNYKVHHATAADNSLKRSPKAEKKLAPGQAKPGAAKKPAHLRDPFTEPSVSYLPKGEAMFTGIEPRAIGSIFVLCVVLGGLVFGGWTVLQEVQKVQFAPVEQTPGVLSQLDPLAPPPSGDGVAAADVELAGSSVSPSAESFSRLYRPEALDVPVLVARDGPIAAIDPDTIGALAPETIERSLASRALRPDTATAFAAPVVVPEPSQGFGPAGGAFVAEAEVEGTGPDSAVPNSPQVVADVAPSVSLLAVRPSWVRVRASDGTVIFEKILNAGEQFDVPLTEAPATLRAGNAGSLYFAVNGQTFGPAGDGPSVVKNVVLSPEALSADYQLAEIGSDADLARFVAVAEATGTTGDQ